MQQKNLETRRVEVLREIRTMKKEVLKEFLHKVKDLEVYLQQLKESSFDTQRYVCLEKSEKWLEPMYTTFKENSVDDALTILKQMIQMNDEEIITSMMENIDSPEIYIFQNYDEYRDMESLEDAFNSLTRAESEMQSFLFNF